ncbi:MAG: molybdopterin-dependent oxidoreductase [Proteobacteria bacterium]|nr:molybdopterin-dependent oxidoreductase [Pseudomonadota bacterium]
MLVSVAADGAVSVAGDPNHPANHGRLCAKGASLGETLATEGRLLKPCVHGMEVDWDAALTEVAKGFTATIAAHGPDSVAFYVSGQLGTEDYYVANKLMKGYIGSANIDTNSRLCMASSVAAHRRAFGEDVVPGVYADLEQAALVVLVGANLAWCHPVLHQRLMAAREQHGTRIVVIDPRATATSEHADLHLALAAGSDVALFNGLLRFLHDADRCERDYIAAHTRDFDAALACAHDYDIDTVCDITGLEREAVTQFYHWFAAEPRTVSAWSQGVNQSSAGTDKVNAIINCHLATARIGLPGCGPLSLTGQPNAMGGREVGGMANTLAAHREFDEPGAAADVQAFWHSPRIATRAGLKAVEMFQAVADGRIKALWIMATNPLVSLPDSAAVAAALAQCPLVVVSDMSAESVTAEAAHIVLPAAGWGEKDATVTNSERRISRQRAFVAAPGEARPDWWMVCEVAKRMGYGAAFDYQAPWQILREYASLTAQGGTRVLDLGALASLSAESYDGLTPRQWPLPAGCLPRAERRLFADGHFAHADGRARFVATPYRGPRARADARHAYIMNSGRTRDQWHTLTRSGRVPRLGSHCAEPYVDMHGADAAALGLGDAALACLERDGQGVLLRVRVSAAQSPGTVFVPMHFSAAHASNAGINALVPAVTDAISGQPELKAARVAVRAFNAAWYGFAVTCSDVMPTSAYWARMRCTAGWRIECADTGELDDIDAWFAGLAGEQRADDDIVVCRDRARHAWRGYLLRDGRLHAALYVARTPVAVAREWLVAQLGCVIQPAQRMALVAGRDASSAATAGAPLCACRAVAASRIREAVQAGHHSLSAIAHATGAGSQCGGCRIEVQRLIDAERRSLLGVS